MRQASFELLGAAASSGIKRFDTSSRYGQSESLISEFLKENPSANVEVISKFAADSWRVDSDNSRQRLGDRLSLLLWHDANMNHPAFAQRLRAVESAAKGLDGIALGCSTYGVEAARFMLSTGLFKALEIEYNLLNPHVLRAIREEAQRKGVRLILRSVFQKGFLTDALLSQAKLDLHSDPAKNEILCQLGARIYRLGKAAGFKIEELALRYALLTSGPEDIVLFGATSPKDVMVNAAIAADDSSNPKVLRFLQEELGQVANEIDPELLFLSHWKS
jgi:aryl-alcohol dehydrogenase-like predicted oxidoreductase